MPHIPIDEIKSQFSGWVLLHERRAMQGIRTPGVYLLALSEDQPAPYRENQDSLIYIGETTRQTLLKRLSSFERSCTSDRPGHSGGVSFRKSFPSTLEAKNLWVSILPVNLDNAHQNHAYIKFVERALIWDYVSKNNRPPTFNIG